jgi:glucose dehydrogenase
MPNTRAARHNGNSRAIPTHAPADLYSNSTVALNPETGKLAWYFQHLPGDDWDLDYTNERTLIRTTFNPDPKFVKWINPDIPKGQDREIVVNIGEGGGMWALDRITGQFLWANPFPYAEPNFLISDIDVKTGRTTINWDLVLKEPGEHHVICAYNTKSYWPMSYHPGKNSFYIPYVDNCLDMTRALPGPNGQRGEPERRRGVRRPGSDPEKFGGIAKVNATTGEIVRFYEGSVPGNGATLATAGDLVFNGEGNGWFKAFDARSGKELWKYNCGAGVNSPAVSYMVNGKQYIAVASGGNTQLDFKRGNSVVVFALQ